MNQLISRDFLAWTFLNFLAYCCGDGNNIYILFLIIIFSNFSGTKVWVTWKDPPNPNLAIIYYNILYKLPNNDKATFCVSAYEFERNGRKYEPSIPGTYQMMIRAVSLSGAGAYTKEVKQNTQTLPCALCMIFTILLTL